MQTAIAQIAALTIFGNDVLRGYSREEFWPASTVFTFCKTVRFAALNGAAETIFADNPVQWISRVQIGGAVGLRFHHVSRNDPNFPDRVSVGFVGGGGRWLIEALHSDQSELWEAGWLIGNRDDPDRKIWNVCYRRVGNSGNHLPSDNTDLVTLKHDLKVALTRIEQFARSQKLANFATSFRKAIDVLESEAPLSGTYHPDLACSFSVPLEARKLLAAAQFAWMFGGMGSWDDLGFVRDQQQEYVCITDILFKLLIRAICQSANSSCI